MKAPGLVLFGLLVASASGAVGAESTTSQLEMVRARIAELEERVMALDAANRSRREERDRLADELELAEARVREVELVLEQGAAEARSVAESLQAISGSIERQRELLRGHVEVMALLGRPGVLQLLYDGTRGGDLEGALSTVTALTSGQLELVAEYDQLQRRRSARLAELSRILAARRAEGEALDRRRAELEEVRARVDEEIRRLARTERNARDELADLRSREEALERLMTTLGDRSRFSGVEDIRRFRGALPWPVEGRVVRSFGKRLLPQYSTYTICNGLRFDAPGGSEVRAIFAGEVAFARFFKGYGNMVVIDHGNDVYSLVAGLATIHVRVKQRVDMGLRLGLASPPAEEGNTYFEIRVGKKPQDPVRWLQLRSPSANRR